MPSPPTHSMYTINEYIHIHTYKYIHIHTYKSPYISYPTRVNHILYTVNHILYKITIDVYICTILCIYIYICIHVCLRFLAEEMTSLSSPLALQDCMYAWMYIYVQFCIYIYMMHACVFTVFSGRDDFSHLLLHYRIVCTRGCIYMYNFVYIYTIYDACMCVYGF